jgi:hypothetical protein
MMKNYFTRLRRYDQCDDSFFRTVIPAQAGHEVKLLRYPGGNSLKTLDPRLRGCVIIQNSVLRGIIFRAKALAYIYNNMIIHSLFLFICLLGHVAQGFNPAKAD